ncbi:MAG TPA: tetratricopeptide repeat protein [Thermoanaerobaculia bacterium]|nr:tetratricopeptide repeat protein [Thermoanaerobaculia bacterium]
MRKALLSILALSLAAVVTVAAGPPNLSSTLEAQRQLAAAHPDDPAAWNDLGNLLILSRRPDEAETAYRHAVELDPKRASAHFNLGLLAEHHGDARAAMKEYKAVLELDPRHAWAHYQIGALLEKSGRDGAAIRAYARAFALDHQLAFAEINPNIIDSKLTTSALLRAYRTEEAPTLAPTRYENPQRLRDLLVAQPAATAPDAAAAAIAAPPSALVAGGGGKTAGTASGPAPGTVLRPQSLQNTGKAGQVLPPGSSRTATGRTATGRPISGGGLHTWTRPEPVEQPVYEEPGTEEEIPAEEEEASPPPSPGSVYFRPGLPSTGRLDLQVIPHRATAPAEARVGRG